MNIRRVVVWSFLLLAYTSIVHVGSAQAYFHWHPWGSKWWQAYPCWGAPHIEEQAARFAVMVRNNGFTTIPENLARDPSMVRALAKQHIRVGIVQNGSANLTATAP